MPTARAAMPRLATAARGSLALLFRLGSTGGGGLSCVPWTGHDLHIVLNVILGYFPAEQLLHVADTILRPLPRVEIVRDGHLQLRRVEGDEDPPGRLVYNPLLLLLPLLLLHGVAVHGEPGPQGAEENPPDLLFSLENCGFISTFLNEEDLVS